MNIIKRTITFLLSVVLITGSMTACGGSDDDLGDYEKDNGFRATSDFFYSSDKGHSYGDGTKEYEIGDTVYMKVVFKVTNDKKKVSQVKVTLTIPQVDNIDAKYMDGQIITPNYDAVNNVTTYEFIADAAKETSEEECVIQFTPNAPGEITMKLEFDDNVASRYDNQNTIIFVEKTDKTTEEEE